MNLKELASKIRKILEKENIAYAIVIFNDDENDPANYSVSGNTCIVCAYEAIEEMIEENNLEHMSSHDNSKEEKVN